VPVSVPNNGADRLADLRAELDRLDERLLDLVLRE